MDKLDQFLREMLIEWAWTDINHPIKQKVLVNMHQPNWMDYLYQDEKPYESKTEIINDMTERTKEKLATKPKEDEIEEWLKDVYKAIYFATKKEFASKFETNKWKMKKINTTGMYEYGPKNHWDEIFFRFRIGYKDGILYWDMLNHLGKINPIEFRHFPDIITKTIQNLGCDILVRKNSKSFAFMKSTGEASNQLFRLLKQIKDEGMGIGNDAHGGLWIQEGKKKKFRITPLIENKKVKLMITNKETDIKIMEIENTEEVLEMKKIFKNQSLNK